MFFLLLSITSLFLYTSTSICAQDINSKIAISGEIKGTDDASLPFAAIALYQTKDSSLVKGTASDENGLFSIPVTKGNYYLQIQFLSYKNKTTSNIEVKDNSIQLGTLFLEMDNASLDEVVVKSERKAMEMRLDKRVFNVEKDPMNKGRNASDILDNLPSVSVDIDGNVSLRGNQNVRILIDGKPSGLVGIRSTDALRQLQGNMIERIEVITNPSARYDAEGEVGIINIVLKKEKRKGINGSFDARAGYPEDFGGGFSLNYRTGVVNLFASYGVGYNKRPGSGWSYQRFFTTDTSFSYNRNREHARGGWSNNVRVGSNFHLSKYDIITVSGLYSYSHGNNNASLIYTDYDQQGIQSQVVTRKEDEIELEQTIEASFNYSRTFKTKGQKFNFDFQFTDSKDEEESLINEWSNISGIPNILQQVANKENEQRWLIQSDYIHPWGKDGKIEAGLKATLRSINNDFTVEEQNASGEWITLSSFDDQFLYTENIYAAYLMAGNKWGSFSAQAGLRFEYSDVKTHLVKSQQINHRQYFNFFPSAHISYKFKKEHSVQVSYSRRINRPRFWWLLPFFGYSDSRNLFSGNPNLNPEYTNSFEIGHLKYWEKGSFLSSIYYRNTTGKMQRLLFSDSTATTQRLPVNLGEEHSFGLEFTASYQPWEWWSMDASANFYRSIILGDYNGTSFDSDTYAWNCRVKSKWTIKKIFHIQLTFNYNSPMITAQGKRFARYHFDAGLSLDLFKGKATLTLNARDIFNTRKRRSIVYEDDFYSESEFQWRSRRVVLNFTYRLNQGNAKTKGRKR